MRAVLLLGLTACSLFAAPGNPPAPPSVPAPGVTSKKLLEFGWDKPRPSALSAAQLDSSPFDGVTFTSSAGDAVIVPEVLPGVAFDADIAALKKINSNKLSNSFYLLNVNADPWDWFDDAAWGKAEQNLYQWARVAREGGLRGILFDPEVYQFDLWAYASQAERAQHSFAQFEAQLRERGAQTMRAFERAYPGITLLFLYSFSAFDAAPGATYEAAHAGLETDGGLGLFAAFLEGMLEAASDRAVLIDGFEPSYYHLKPTDFDAGRQAALEGAQVFVRPDLRPKFQRQARFANAIYVDGVMNLWGSARFFGYFMKNDTDRRALLTHNVYHGLRSSDEFVWVYAENPNWWKRTGGSTDFAALEAALIRGKTLIEAGKALEPDPAGVIASARTAFDARVNVGGDIRGRTGLNLDFGALGPHCATWNNAQRWSCTQPGGSSFTVTPTASGVSFEPASRAFTNQTKDDWNVNFTIR